MSKCEEPYVESQCEVPNDEYLYIVIYIYLTIIYINMSFIFDVYFCKYMLLKIRLSRKK